MNTVVRNTGANSQITIILYAVNLLYDKLWYPPRMNSKLTFCTVFAAFGPISACSTYRAELSRSASMPGKLKIVREIPVEVEVVTQPTIFCVPPVPSDKEDDACSDITLPISPNLHEFLERYDLPKTPRESVPFVSKVKLYGDYASLPHSIRGNEADLANQLESLIKQINRWDPCLITDEIACLMGTGRCYIHNLRTGYIPNKVIYAAHQLLTELRIVMSQCKK